ncbi:MAG TPA: universal stress protein [Pyrinomonadaceae bacterium]|jgi:Universal stress protein UspA and related nucleotide-binding proteins|nr:universal stress protein [Pyrinomonadaceae bacterium]
MYPFRNILYPTDFSQNARAALKYAAAFARNDGGRVVMFNVQSAQVPRDLLKSPAKSFEEQWLLQVRSDAKNFLADPSFQNIDVEVEFADGEPSTEIARAAVEHEIDLVTIVTRGRKGRLSRAFGGSIAEEIVAESPCAVLAIRQAQRDFVAHREGRAVINLNRILLATNFRPASVAATSLATQIANHMGAQLHAVYVIGDYFDQISAMFPEGGLAALTRLRSYVEERMTHLARADGSRAMTHVAEGRPYEEIVRLAAKTEADLIVIGTAVHNSLFGGSPVLGSEIERVIRNAPCPVMCVPAGRVMTPIPAFVASAVPT